MMYCPCTIKAKLLLDDVIDLKVVSHWINIVLLLQAYYQELDD